MIDLLRVLPIAARSILIGFIDNDLDAAALAVTLLSTLFLYFKNINKSLLLYYF